MEGVGEAYAVGKFCWGVEEGKIREVHVREGLMEGGRVGNVPGWDDAEGTTDGFET